MNFRPVTSSRTCRPSISAPAYTATITRSKVEIQSPCLDDRGFCQVDYGELDGFKRYVDETFEHRHLNDVIAPIRPTAENIARFLFTEARKASPYVVAVTRERDTANLGGVPALRLNDIYPTIQGEGCLTGTPMVLIRLQGCGVGCPWCDTKETWENDPANRVVVLQDAMGTNARWIDASAETIASKARQAGPSLRWALVTGGEPAEQELAPLVDALHDAKFKVAIETSGTALGHVGAAFNWVCVSPKFSMPGGKPVLPRAFLDADEIKQVVGKAADIERLDAFLASATIRPTCTISLQPVSQSAKATELCVATCLERGWRLSLQMHKYLNVR